MLYSPIPEYKMYWIFFTHMYLDFFSYFAFNLYTKRWLNTCVSKKDKTSYILEWREHLSSLCPH
jgi:hypothetical protein